MDWIKMGWGEGLSQTPSPTEQFVLDVSAGVRSNRGALEAAIEAVREIACHYPPPYTLMVSGGVDSQAMLWAWHKSRIPFTARAVVYPNPKSSTPFNADDLENLWIFAERSNIPVTTQSFDVLNFIDSGKYKEYAIAYQCISPMISTHMAMADDVSTGTIVFSGNLMNTTTFAALDYTILGLHRYATATNTDKRATIPFFFLHTPKLAFAFVIKEAVFNADSYINKYELYLKHGFPVIPQQRKMTGFEQIKDHYDQFPELVPAWDRIRFGNQPSKRVFELAFRYKTTDYVKYDNNIKIVCDLDQQNA